MIFNKIGIRKRDISTTDTSLWMVRMVTSYSIFLLIILFLSTYLYISTRNNMRSQFRQQNKSILRDSISLLDKDLDIMELFCRQLLQDNSIIRLANAEGPQSNDFILDGFSTKKSLSSNLYAEVLLPIDEYYIHFENSGYLLSSNHFVEQSLFYTGTRLYPPDLYEQWLEFMENEEYHNTFLSLDAYTRAPSVHYYMYVVDLNNLTNKKLQAETVFIIDAKKLSNIFKEIKFYENGYLIATDNTGNILFSLSDRRDPYDSGDFDSALLRNLTYKGDYAEFNENGEKMIVTKQASSSTNWYYYLVQPDSASLIAIHSYQTLFIIILIFAFVIGVWMIFVFTRHNIRPITKLGQELHEAVETQNHLQEVVDKQKPIICSSYVRQLMLGTISTKDEMDYIQDYLGMGRDNVCFNILYAVVYDNRSESEESVLTTNDESQFHAVISSMEQFWGTPLYHYIPNDRAYAILLSCDKEDEDSFIMQTQDRVLKLHNYLLEHHSIWLFAGMGRNTDSLMNVWEAYQQAQDTVNYATKNYIFLPYEIIKKSSDAFYYPTELSTKLIHFITSGNKAQVLELFNLIHHENIEERSLPLHLLKFLLSDIRNTMLKARFTAPANTDSSALDALDAKFNEPLSFKLCEDIAISLCNIFQKKEDTSLSATIEKYIIENYADPSMCLNKISDEFQISESYFSHMFKEKNGINFSVYLENIRMTEAARLIRETKINLSELYLIVGYNNSNTFRRAFKKTFGVSPSSMRETVANIK